MGVARSGFYYEPVPETPENLAVMRQLDELHLAHPVYGNRRLTALLRRAGLEINRKRVVRLLQVMGVEAGLGIGRGWRGGVSENCCPPPQRAH